MVLEHTKAATLLICDRPVAYEPTWTADPCYAVVSLPCFLETLRARLTTVGLVVIYGVLGHRAKADVAVFISASISGQKPLIAAPSISTYVLAV